MTVPTNDMLTDPKKILAAKQASIGASSACSIAVAFWGRGAVDELGIPSAAEGTRIILNADSGACNPAELTRLMDLKNVEVRNAPKLHAKVVIGGESLIVGSANASANGLGFQGKEQSGWHEACIQSTDKREIGQMLDWFEKLWMQSEPLDDIVLARAAKAWLRHRRSVLQDRLDGGEIIEWDGRAVYVVTTDEESDYSEADASGKAKTAGLDESSMEYFQDWSEMPKDALLLNYETERHSGKSTFEGAWSTISPVRRMTLNNGQKVYPVFKANQKMRSAFGLGVADRDLRWNDAVSRFNALMKNPKIRAETKKLTGVDYNRATDWCIPLFHFLAICEANSIELPKTWKGR